MSSSNGNHYDVIVIGAGPAGSTLGYELAGKGAKVLILEKEKLPRYKTCAGGITVKAANLIGMDFRDIVQDTTFGVRVTYKHKKEFTKWYDKPLVYMVMRNEFDYLLAQRAQSAGAVLAENQKVTGLQVSPGGVEVITDRDTFTGEVIAGADGARGKTARNLGLMKGLELGIGIEAEVPVSKEEKAGWESLIGLELGRIKGGYGWIFPKRNILSIGAGGLFTQVKKLKPCYQEIISSNKLAGGISAGLKGHLLPLRRNGSAIQGERSLLLGDAAGLIDPFTGEGIYNAAKSAQMAAPAILRSLKTGNMDLSPYQEAIDRELMPELRASRGFAKVFSWFPGLYFDAVQKSDRIWRAHCRLLRGEESYVSIKKRLGAFQFIFNLVSR